MATEFDLVKQDLARERGERQRLSLENSQLKQQLDALKKEKLELENNCDNGMLNLEMPDDCLPALIACDLVMQDLALEREKCQRLLMENIQLKQQLAALRKDKTEVEESETDIRIQLLEKDLLIHRLQEEIQNRGSTQASPEVAIPRRIEVEDNCDIEMLNLEMPDDCLPSLIAAKHNKELLEMSNEELELAIKNEAFCTDCFQSSHRMCKGEMPNLLDLKKHSKGRKMLEYLETLNAEGRVSKMTAKRSIAVTKEDLIAKVKQMMETDMRTPDVDASVTVLTKKIQDFTKTVLDFEENIDSVFMKMVEIGATPPS